VVESTFMCLEDLGSSLMYVISVLIYLFYYFIDMLYHGA